ncbi:MAG: hypothetical protein A2134_02060 [Candidatus Woykebacteria bacterium RBG_16_39_9b]|uniref:Uncharacterized protein n=1 Tax=Candidatus Woykebacteria bacterium RBG_16_39_9b TaxID=1802595 RepID=A0A1G1WC40_9BACT|nr:MAG: hypothetical protein A2134_02060 [Candidatus Woykebacteria bacterium RBG_16_39_9b]
MHDRLLLIVALLLVGIAIALWATKSQGDDGQGRSVEGITIQISPQPTTIFDAAACPPDKPVYNTTVKPEDHQAIVPELRDFLDQGPVQGEHFCMFQRQERYLVTLDFRGGADPVGELHEWFAEREEPYFGKYPRSPMCELYVIDIPDSNGRTEPLCLQETPAQPEQPEEENETDGVLTKHWQVPFFFWVYPGQPSEVGLTNKQKIG